MHFIIRQRRKNTRTTKTNGRLQVFEQYDLPRFNYYAEKQQEALRTSILGLCKIWFCIRIRL